MKLKADVQQPFIFFTYKGITSLSHGMGYWLYILLSILEESLSGYQGDHLIRFPPYHGGHVQDKYLHSGKIQGNFQAFVVFDFFIKQEGFKEFIPVLKKNLLNQS
jgi:hypothetical protein